MDFQTLFYSIVIAAVGFVLGWLFGFAESATVVDTVSYSW